MQTRNYLAVQGGFDLPEYMGSRATFTLGRFGGHLVAHCALAMCRGCLGRLRSVSRVQSPARAAATKLCLALEHPRTAWITHGAPGWPTRRERQPFFPAAKNKTVNGKKWP